jgi:hypothetical protein
VRSSLAGVSYPGQATRQGEPAMDALPIAVTQTDPMRAIEVTVSRHSQVRNRPLDSGHRPAQTFVGLEREWQITWLQGRLFGRCKSNQVRRA